MLLIAAALTGTLMLALAGVLAAGGLPSTSLSPASVSGPGGPLQQGRIESAPARAPAPEPPQRPLARYRVGAEPAP